MATSTQWRVYIPSTSFRIYEFQFRTVAGTPQLFSGGTISANNQDAGLASNAADNNAVAGSFWAVGVASFGWWQYTYPTPVEIVQYTIDCQGTLAPDALQFQYFDGTSWITADSRSGLGAGWASGSSSLRELKTFTVGVKAAQVSQVVVEVLRLPDPKVQASQVVIEVLRSNGTEAPKALTKQNVESLEFAFSGQPFIQAGPSDLDSSGLDYAFGGQPFLFTPDDVAVVVTPPVVSARKRLQQFIVM